MTPVTNCIVVAEEGEVLLECGCAVASLTPDAARETADLLHERGTQAEEQTAERCKANR